MSSGLPPSQGYKVSGEGVPGGGPDATKQQGTTTTYPGGTDRPSESGPQQEVAGTLPTNFSLGPTKAESKGEDRQPVYNHDIDDVIGHPSHMAPQSQYSSNPPHKKPTES